MTEGGSSDTHQGPLDRESLGSGLRGPLLVKTDFSTGLPTHTLAHLPVQEVREGSSTSGVGGRDPSPGVGSTKTVEPDRIWAGVQETGRVFGSHRRRRESRLLCSKTLRENKYCVGLRPV